MCPYCLWCGPWLLSTSPQEASSLKTRGCGDLESARTKPPCAPSELLMLGLSACCRPVWLQRLPCKHLVCPQFHQLSSLGLQSPPLVAVRSSPCAGVQVGCADILGRIVEDLKDESEPYRRMVMETIDKVVSDLGTADVDARLEELLIDGILYAFQEQVRLEEDSLCCLVCRVFHVSTGGEYQTPCLISPQRMPSADMLCQHCRKTDHRLNAVQ